MAVSLTFTGDSVSAEAAIARLERKYADLENKVKQSGKVSKEASDFASASFDNLGRSILASVAPIALAQQGIRLLSNEYQNLINMQDKSKDANVNFARTLTNLALNTDTPLADIKLRIDKLADSTKMDQNDLANILNEAQAAKGQLDEKVVDPTIVAVSRVARANPQAAQSLVGASLDAQKQIEGITPEQSIGFLLNAAAKSRVVDPEKFARHAIPAILGSQKVDSETSIESAAALNNALTQGSGDVEGRKTKTAQIALVMQLQAALPELKNTEERIAAMQASPELRDAFLKGGKAPDGRKLSKMKFDVKGPDGEVLQLDSDHASFERQMVPAITGVLTKNSFEDKILRDSQKAIPSLAQSAASYEARATAMEEDPNLQVFAKDAEFKGKTKKAQLKNTAGAMDATTRQGVEELMQAEGFTSSYRNQIEWRAYPATLGGKSRAEATRDVLLHERDFYEKYPKTHEVDADAIAENNKTLEMLDHVIEAIENRVAKKAVANPGGPIGQDPNQQNAEETKKNTDELRKLNDNVARLIPQNSGNETRQLNRNGNRE